MQLEREALRLHRRYAREIVEAFGLCPFAERARVSGASTESVVLDRAPTIESVRPLVRRLGDDASIEVAFIIFPRWDIDRLGLSRFVEALRSAHQAERGGAVLRSALASLHVRHHRPLEGQHVDACPCAELRLRARADLRLSPRRRHLPVPADVPAVPP